MSVREQPFESFPLRGIDMIPGSFFSLFRVTATNRLRQP